MFPITQEAEIWNITSLDMYLDTHKVSSNFEKFFFVSKKNACFLSILGCDLVLTEVETPTYIRKEGLES